ncbi:hypothetical protein ACJX0J_011457, partial [Zea mays]
RNSIYNTLAPAGFMEIRQYLRFIKKKENGKQINNWERRETKRELSLKLAYHGILALEYREKWHGVSFFFVIISVVMHARMCIIRFVLEPEKAWACAADKFGDLYKEKTWLAHGSSIETRGGIFWFSVEMKGFVRTLAVFFFNYLIAGWLGEGKEHSSLRRIFWHDWEFRAYKYPMAWHDLDKTKRTTICLYNILNNGRSPRQSSSSWLSGLATALPADYPRCTRKTRLLGCTSLAFL